jgi:hypothetical protein
LSSPAAAGLHNKPWVHGQVKGTKVRAPLLAAAPRCLLCVERSGPGAGLFAIGLAFSSEAHYE